MTDHVRHARRPPPGGRVHDPPRDQPDPRWRSRRRPASREFQTRVGFALRPVQGAIHGVARHVASVRLGGRRDRPAPRRQRDLRRENERLTHENLRRQAIERENEQLTALLQLRNAFEYQTVAAEVIARESTEIRPDRDASTKGTDDGIAVGDVVIAEGGALVGRVSDGRARTSRT